MSAQPIDDDDYQRWADEQAERRYDEWVDDQTDQIPYCASCKCWPCLCGVAGSSENCE